MHIANVSVKKDWEKLESLISEKIGSSFTFNSSKNYYFTNCGGYNTLFLDSSEEPESSSNDGIVVCLKEQVGFKSDGGTIYVKCPSGTTNIHIEEEN